MENGKRKMEDLILPDHDDPEDRGDGEGASDFFGDRVRQHRKHRFSEKGEERWNADVDSFASGVADYAAIAGVDH